jgi:hypothetical protein
MRPCGLQRWNVNVSTEMLLSVFSPTSCLRNSLSLHFLFCSDNRQHVCWQSLTLIIPKRYVQVIQPAAQVSGCKFCCTVSSFLAAWGAPTLSIHRLPLPDRCCSLCGRRSRSARDLRWPINGPLEDQSNQCTADCTARNIFGSCKFSRAICFLRRSHCCLVVGSAPR